MEQSEIDEVATWLEGVGIDALRELALANMHGKRQAEVVEHILTNEQALANARESMLIERRARNRAEAQRYSGRTLRRL